MRDFGTLIELLRVRADQDGDRDAYVFLQDGAQVEQAITGAELDRRARALGAWLMRFAEPGARVLLAYPAGLEFITAFFGCLYAGMIAVPASPAHPSQRSATRSRITGVVDSARPTLALTLEELLPALGALLNSNPGAAAPRCLASDSADVTDELAEEWRRPEVDEQTVALLQYTSGSTGSPNGVELTHANLLHNSAHIHRSFQHGSGSRGVIWLPPQHDMGLIGGVLQPLYGGFPVTLMSPIHFLQQPRRWLDAISRTKATTSGGPTFAYELCVAEIAPSERAGLDLSSWDLAFVGAEPVSAQTLERFAATYEPYGFRPEAFYPCYGLAEATLMVSGGSKYDPPVVTEVLVSEIEEQRVVPAAGEGAGTRKYVSCGWSLADQEVIIVDPETFVPTSPDRVGEIWVRGPSVARGYWESPEETARSFGARLAGTGEGPFLRTGDLGFLAKGHLFIAGRCKDLIIIAGRNHHPQDIEQTIERSHTSIPRGGCAAFSVEVEGEERLVIAAEVDRRSYRELMGAARLYQELLRAVRQAVTEAHGIAAHRIVVVGPVRLPRTTNGKIRRGACRTRFLTGDLEEVKPRNEETSICR